MKKIVLILMFLLGACSVSNEHINTTNLYASSEIVLQSEETFYINGVITQETEDELRQIGASGIKYVVLDSPGGILDVAYNIGNIISAYEISTVIPRRATCRSACTVVFQSGKNRYISRSGDLVYHSPRYGREYMNSFFEECPIRSENPECGQQIYDMTLYIFEETDRMYSFLEEHGLSTRIRELVKATPIADSWFEIGNFTRYGDLVLNYQQAIEHNAATDILN